GRDCFRPAGPRATLLYRSPTCDSNRLEGSRQPRKSAFSFPAPFGRSPPGERKIDLGNLARAGAVPRPGRLATPAAAVHPSGRVLVPARGPTRPGRRGRLPGCLSGRGGGPGRVSPRARRTDVPRVAARHHAAQDPRLLAVPPAAPSRGRHRRPTPPGRSGPDPDAAAGNRRSPT